MPTVRIQVIKVYDVEVPDCDDPIAAAYDMQTTDIQEHGDLIDVSTDHAELVDDDEENED